MSEVNNFKSAFEKIIPAKMSARDLLERIAIAKFLIDQSDGEFGIYFCGGSKDQMQTLMQEQYVIMEIQKYSKFSEPKQIQMVADYIVRSGIALMIALRPEISYEDFFDICVQIFMDKAERYPKNASISIITEAFAKTMDGMQEGTKYKNADTIVNIEIPGLLSISHRCKDCTNMEECEENEIFASDPECIVSRDIEEIATLGSDDDCVNVGGGVKMGTLIGTHAESIVQEIKDRVNFYTVDENARSPYKNLKTSVIMPDGTIEFLDCRNCKNKDQCKDKICAKEEIDIKKDCEAFELLYGTVNKNNIAKIDFVADGRVAKIYIKNSANVTEFKPSMLSCLTYYRGR